jgi:hypothetical protein
MGMEIDPLPEGLDDAHNTGDELCAGCCLEVMEEGLDGRMAELTKKLPPELEEDAEHFGNDKDDLAMRDVQNKLLPHPFAPLLKPFGMAGGTESSRSTGEGQKEISATARTADAGEPTARVAAVEMFFYNLTDDLPEIPVLLLEPILIF